MICKMHAVLTKVMLIGKGTIRLLNRKTPLLGLQQNTLYIKQLIISSRLSLPHIPSSLLQTLKHRNMKYEHHFYPTRL